LSLFGLIGPQIVVWHARARVCAPLTDDTIEAVVGGMLGAQRDA
jgi:hypothetical protein